ncbi:hypothetical protein FRC04_004757 [Tulasnella sp. 424]|nr:hypothetical protein FRC04_004757 [Tulasnella sp. 424]
MSYNSSSSSSRFGHSPAISGGEIRVSTTQAIRDLDPIVFTPWAPLRATKLPLSISLETWGGSVVQSICWGNQLVISVTYQGLCATAEDVRTQVASAILSGWSAVTV